MNDPKRSGAGNPDQVPEQIRQLERQLAQYRIFADSVEDYALITFTPDNRIAGWSRGAECLTGYTEAEALGQYGGIIFTPEDRQAGAVEKEFQTAARNGRAEDERWHLRKDGTRFWGSGVMTAMRDGTGFAKIMRDLTARQEQQNQQQKGLKAQVRSAAAALERSNDQLRALAARLIRAQEDERRRIARELHDDISQRLAVVEIGLTGLQDRFYPGSEERKQIRDLVREMTTLSADVRSLSHGLHPSALDDLGLEAALRQLVEGFERTTGMAVHIRAQLSPSCSLAPSVATAIYRISQEALHNVAKHAKDASVTLHVSATTEQIRLTISDDGGGFNVESASVYGLGLISMKERATAIGGTLDMQSDAEGTRITLVAPCRQPHGDASL